MKYKAVLFDMDGTVLDTLGDLANAVNHILREYSMPERSCEEIAAFLGNGASWLISKSAAEGTPPELIERMLADYTPWYVAHNSILTRPYEGIVELMHSLRRGGVRLAVISNKQDASVKPLAELYFPKLLDIAVGECEGIHRKPDPDAVLHAIESMGLNKSECVYVGDTEVDVKTAENAGIACAAVSWGFRSRRQLEDCGAGLIFDNVAQLSDYLLS